MIPYVTVSYLNTLDSSSANSVIILVKKVDVRAKRFNGEICILNVYTLIMTLLLYLSGLEAGSVGLALSYAVTLMGMFQWGVRQSAEVENLVRSVYPH